MGLPVQSLTCCSWVQQPQATPPRSLALALCRAGQLPAHCSCVGNLFLSSQSFICEYELSGTGKTLTGGHPEDGLMSCVACCSHVVTRERHQSVPRERLMQKQNWDQKRSCLVALSLFSTIAHSPRIMRTGCPTKAEELLWQALIRRGGAMLHQ